MNPAAFTVGASGAIFGILGAGVVLERRHIYVFGGGALGVVLLNVLFAFAVPNISTGGHFGGLVGGALAVLALAGFGRGHPAYRRIDLVTVAARSAWRRSASRSRTFASAATPDGPGPRPFSSDPAHLHLGPTHVGLDGRLGSASAGKADGVEMSPYARLVEVCERLAAATTGGQAEWAAEEETGFVCRRQSGSVGIRSRDRDGEPPYELVIYSPKGEKVENLLSEWSSEEEPAFWNPALAELYRAARRNALGVDRILDDLFAELPPARAGERTPA